MSGTVADIGRVKVGQVWKEVDPRITRYVKVLGVDETTAMVRAVYMHDSGAAWLTKQGSRVTHPLLARFNGKRGGYVLHEEAQ